MASVGVIGCGYWGPNYVRIFNELSGSSVSYCSDLEQKNLSKIKNLYPAIKTTKDYKVVAEDKNTDSIVVTTPLNTHYKIAKHCLESGKHVLIEKPFTSRSDEGAELMKIAKKNGLVLMVGHVYEHHPGVRKLKEIIDGGKLGSIYYMSAERVGLGPIRKYASALWDLATHDISIALYLLGSSPTRVIADGESYIQKDVADLVFLTLKFPNSVLCNIHASWIAPEKIRKITVVGSKGMAVFDDVNKSEMLKIYEREIDISLLNSTPEYTDHQSIVRIGNVYAPEVEKSEPLKNQCVHFLECIAKKKKPLTDAQDGINVVKVLESAEKSLVERKVR
jgi:predicted dehydrogenase